MDAILYKKIQDGLAPVVKSVQRGLTTSTTQGSVSINISEVDPNKSIVLSSFTSDYTGASVRMSLSSATQIQYYCECTNVNFIAWQVIEFY